MKKLYTKNIIIMMALFLTLSLNAQNKTEYMSYFASVYVRTVLGMKVYDTTAGFKCYRRKVLETIDLDKVRLKGYGFQIEMKYSTFRLGFRIKEVPIIFVDRKEGTSKMSSGIFGEAFWGVIGMRFRKIRPKA